MILKRRKKPIELQKLEALIPRLPQSYPGLSQIKHDAARCYKGYIGERKVDYFIEQLSESHTILHDLSLEARGQRFQIDTLVISDYAIYIIETKNFNGTITFNTILNQFTRDDGYKETGYRYPITQAGTSQLKLMNWLQERDINHIPIRYFIAISDPSTIIKVIGTEQGIAEVVAHGEYVPQKILAMNEQLKTKNISSSKWTRHQLGKKLLKSHTDQDFDILKKYNIFIQDILPGVICPKCENLGMERIHGRWFCKSCKFKSRRAHVRTLNDFFLLNKKKSITNKESRWFLQVNSRYTAKRLLKLANLKYNNNVWEKV